MAFFKKDEFLMGGYGEFMKFLSPVMWIDSMLSIFENMTKLS